MNVREILQTHSQSTTLRELEAKGRSRVRVINANQIAELIEASVRRTLAQAETPDDLKALVERSKAEFFEMQRQRDTERKAREEGLRQLEEAKDELVALATEVEKLRETEGAKTTRIGELEHQLSCEKGRVEEARRLVEMLTRERDVARQAEQEARAAASAVKAAPSPESTEMLSRLAAEVARLNERMNATPPPAAPAPAPAATAESQALATRLDALSQGIADRLEKFGRTIGVSSAVDAQEVKYDALFNKQDSFESNLNTLEVKERQGSGIRGALDRMKRMRLSGKDEPDAAGDAAKK